MFRGKLNGTIVENHDKLGNDAYDEMISEIITLIKPEVTTRDLDRLRFLILYKIEEVINNVYYSALEKDVIIQGIMKAYHDVWSEMIPNQKKGEVYYGD
jgi:hypothetical protein